MREFINAKVFLFTILLLSFSFYGRIFSTQRNHYLNSSPFGKANFSQSNGEITLSGTRIINDEETLNYTNKTIYYDSSIGPIFQIYGTLVLQDCVIIPLQGAIDFLSGNGGAVFLENISLMNTDGAPSGTLFSLTSSYLYINQANFSGFASASVSNHADIFISGLSASISEDFSFHTTDNFTLVNSDIHLVGDEPVRLVQIGTSVGVNLINNTITLPLANVQTHGAWLEGISLCGNEEVIVLNNTVINGGKTLVSYGCMNVLIKNNNFTNEELIEGTELQITDNSENVLITTNYFCNLWDTIELYSQKNITACYNEIIQPNLGFAIEPGDPSSPAEIFIYNNSQWNGYGVISNANGLQMENNSFHDLDYLTFLNCANVLFNRNTLKSTQMNVIDSENFTVINNRIFIPSKDFVWLVEDNSSINQENNSIILLDKTPPSITSVSHSPSTPTSDETIVITAAVTDESNVQSVTVHYRINISSWSNISMSVSSGSTFEAAIGPFTAGSLIEYYITAVDNSYFHNIGTNDNNTQYYSFIIISPITTPSENDSIVSSSQSTPLSWFFIFLGLGIYGVLQILVIVRMKKKRPH